MGALLLLLYVGGVFLLYGHLDENYNLPFSEKIIVSFLWPFLIIICIGFFIHDIFEKYIKDFLC